jgi:DMSO/TMAO reductase YedYZ molybdopterin-dependent catalytic subunit
VRSGRRLPAWPVAWLGGACAALAVWAGMVMLRSALQVRSVPERLMEWMLLFVPLDLFEAGLQRFGFAAKRYALYGATAVMIAALAALGALALRRRWSGLHLLALGLGLWLFVMVIVLPLTSAGFFGWGLINGTRAAIGTYLALGLTFASTLAVVQALLDAVTPSATRTAVQSTGQAAENGAGRPFSGSRRAAVPLVGSTLAAYGATFLGVRFLPSRDRLTPAVVAEPQQPLPSGGIEPPDAHPRGAETPRAGEQPNPAGAARSAATTTAFDPPPPRRLPRDRDGAALASGRRPGELAEPITSNDDFYIVTKNAAGDPVLNASSWRLRIDGEVPRSVEVDYVSLRRLPAVEVIKTQECISNFVAKCELAPFGCDLISTARWRGVRVSDVLALAGGVKPGAISLATLGADEYDTALPIDVALSPDTLLVYEMNGQVLPREHGYPLRMLVPGRYGMKNAKWVVGLRVLSREFLDWYGQRDWSRQAIVKTMTRIDVPAPGAVLPRGEHRIAGIAYAGDRGVEKVEYSADGGSTWRTAEFVEPPAGRDVWVRWRGTFTLAAGATLTLTARATDGTGALQPEAFSLPQPDGGAGWCTVDVRSA